MKQSDVTFLADFPIEHFAAQLTRIFASFAVNVFHVTFHVPFSQILAANKTNSPLLFGLVAIFHVLHIISVTNESLIALLTVHHKLFEMSSAMQLQIFGPFKLLVAVIALEQVRQCFVDLKVAFQTVI